jgi:GNAT superfamily N-acetyltransferase
MPAKQPSNAPVEITAVRTAHDRSEFLQFPWKIYRGDALWVPPLLAERRKAIDPRTGTFFRRGEAAFFIARRAGRPVGTICAAEDRAYNAEMGKRECMFGFFECREGDEEAAGALVRRAAEWATARGLETLGGPFNLDYEDAYGVLVDGRDRPPVMLCGHTPAWYRGFFERRGFVPLRGENLAYEVRLDSTSPALARTEALAQRITDRGWIRLRTPDLSRWMDEVEVVQDLMNRAMAHLPDFRPWTREAVAGLLEPFKDIADPELILFAEIEGKTIGWLAGVGDVNEVLIHLNGLRRPWDYLRALKWMRHKPKCLAVKSILILPEYWGSGAAILLIGEMARRAREKGYEWVDLSLTSDDNPYTPGLATRMGGRIYKRYLVYGRKVSEILAS